MRSRPATPPIRAPRASAARAEPAAGRGPSRRRAATVPRPLGLAASLLLLAFAGACQTVPGDAATEPAPALETRADEAVAAAVFERLKASPPRLRAFLRAMPKGADLHSHLGGAIYAESYLDWAAEDGLCVDVSRLVLVSCDDAEPACGEGGPPPPFCHRAEDLVPVADAVLDRTFRGRLIDALSTRNYRIYGRSGHDQFFATFRALGAAGRGREAEVLAEVMRRAAAQNILYLELMTSPGMSHAAALAAGVEWNDDLAAMRAALADADLDRIVEGTSAYLAANETAARELLGCGAPAAEPACGVTVRLLAQTIRVIPSPQVFAQMVYAFRLVRAEPRMVGINLVAPEDDPVALADYTRHMRAVAFAAREAPGAGIALHAGELTLGLVPPEELRSHIRQAVEIAGAQRIGHGTDLMYEDDPAGLLALMRERDVAVEISPTSSDVILGVTGDDHPLPVYLEAGVPVALATDDEGVSRIDLTHEYHRAALTWDLDYATVKTISRHSLAYAFLPEAEKAALLAELDRRFAGFEAGFRQPPTTHGANDP